MKEQLRQCENLIVLLFKIILYFLVYWSFYCLFAIRNWQLLSISRTAAVTTLSYLISGYLFGLCMHVMDTDVAAAAAAKIPAYTISFPFFLKSVFCGIIMYLAVKMYREKNLFGIFFGVPLFIFCGFQHCIANIITIGASGTISPYLIGCMLLCIAGNFAGSLAAAYLCEPRH